MRAPGLRVFVPLTSPTPFYVETHHVNAKRDHRTIAGTESSVSADDRLKEQRDALVVVEHTGDLQWMPQAILNSSCAFDILFFPFDEQVCSLKFGSWTYDGNALNMDFVGGLEQMDMTDYVQSNEWDVIENVGVRNVKYYTCCPEPYPDMTFTVAEWLARRTRDLEVAGGLEQMDMTDYVQSNEWDVIENVGVRNVKYYTCCPEPYPDMTFTLRLKRKVAFYTFILILPCGLLSLLTMVIFWVPPESPAKLQLGMNIFLAFFVLLLLLADYTPRAAASIPLIATRQCSSLSFIPDYLPLPHDLALTDLGAYFCLSMIMITLSTVLACVVANMYFRGIRINRAPRWLRSCVIDSAARMFCVHEVLRERRHQPPTTPRKMWSTYVTGVRSQSDPETLVAKTHLLEARPFNRHELRDYGAFQEASGEFCDPDEPSTSTAFNSYYSASGSPSTSDDAMLIDEIATIREMMEEDEAYQDSLEEGARYTQEWRMIACVMDRIFFSFYIAVNFFGLLAMYLRSLFS
ncbi:neuronal acetylcholine receptor subunit alpha-7 [Elysia marginata]|uniref:Neuronal acetylcholine receptor subunit alpha-7 n=1 Tax=Elysia marginata TaxID=1093978 RepID=A0AAV4IKA8_9GAST|nr:neuronal acetylcholine receptor subunit alpha-7 [Elysia marginata]